MTWFPEEYDVGVFIGRKESEQCHAGFETHSRKFIWTNNFEPFFAERFFEFGLAYADSIFKIRSYLTSLDMGGQTSPRFSK